MPALLLHPADPYWLPTDVDGFLDRLRHSGLIGGRDDSERWLTGERFMQWVMFLGCSPQLALHPDAAPEGDYCYLRLRLHRDGPRFVSAHRRPAPRCPMCRTPLTKEPTPADVAALHTCEACTRQVPLHALDWRRAAGFASCFIEVNGVYPHEAVPADSLLAELAAWSACAWTFCYC